MRRIITEMMVYNYDELSPEAKQKVKEWYLDGLEAWEWENFCLESLAEQFPESDLKVQFDFSCCQGSGFNIYGNLKFKDFISYCEKIGFITGLTKKEIKALQWYDNHCLLPLKLKQNERYTYFCQKKESLIENIMDELENNCIRGINHNTVEKLCGAVYSVFNLLCHDLYSEGYNFYYEIDEKDLAEICDSNNWEFTADGKLY